MQDKLKEVTRDRNREIRAARADRYGPSEIAAAADLTPEHVRRICLSDDDD